MSVLVVEAEHRVVPQEEDVIELGEDVVEPQQEERVRTALLRTQPTSLTARVGPGVLSVPRLHVSPGSFYDGLEGEGSVRVPNGRRYPGTAGGRTPDAKGHRTVGTSGAVAGAVVPGTGGAPTKDGEDETHERILLNVTKGRKNGELQINRERYMIQRNLLWAEQFALFTLKHLTWDGSPVRVN